MTFYAHVVKPIFADCITKSAGALLFACCMGGWYLLLALMLPTVDFPLELPLGDLSHLIPGKSQLKKNKEPDVPEDGRAKA